MIVANHITKRYAKTTALDDVTFTIEAGESVALWGENGAGKTTAIRCLLGVQGFEGDLTVNGVSVRKAGKSARAMIGYVPQEAKFYDLSIIETVRFYAKLKRVATMRIMPVLEQVQLTQHQHKRVSMLSGGMKQRLALAIALLADPPILILDEPTANLDVAAQRDFIRTIKTLNQMGKTVVFSSHRLDEVLVLASRVLVLAGGKLSFECLPHELTDKLGLHRWLRIWVNPTHHQPMRQALDENGFRYQMNGHSVFVPVAGDEKGAPLWTLQQANIPIEDFDFVSGELLIGQDVNHD